MTAIMGETVISIDSIICSKLCAMSTGRRGWSSTSTKSMKYVKFTVLRYTLKSILNSRLLLSSHVIYSFHEVKGLTLEYADGLYDRKDNSSRHGYMPQPCQL